jgi:hypothetical protein
MGILFKAKTNEGFMFKILGEILHNTFKIIPINITNEGIFSKVIDSHKKILLDIQLFSKNFNTWTFNNSEDILFGLNISHFYKIINSIKKKDSLTFIIDSENINELQIIITPREKDHVEISTLFIQNIQLIDVEVPNNYKHPVHVTSSKFQKMCKDLLNIGKEISIYGNEDYVVFECETPGIFKKKITFGENSKDDSNIHMVYTYLFDSEQLVKISKISSLFHILYIYLEKDMPLLIKTQIGTIGNISIYIK